MKIKLSEEKLRYIALFEKLTDVTPRDCVESEDGSRLTFVIDTDEMGKAIGEGGRNIKKVRKKLDKSVEVVEYSDDPEEFLKNIFSPVEVTSVKVEEKEGKKIATVSVEETEKGRAVGRNGWNIERVRKLSNRHHGIKEVSFA